MKKFHVILFINDGFDSIESSHSTRAAAVKAAKRCRNEWARDNRNSAYDNKFNFRVARITLKATTVQDHYTRVQS